MREGGIMSGLYILITNGRTFVGRGIGDGPDSVLSPVYDLGMGQGPDGQLVHVAAPVLGLPSLESIPVPEGSILIAVTDLSREDQTSVARAFEMGEKMRAAIRAKQSGILVAGAMPRGDVLDRDGVAVHKAGKGVR